MSARAKHRILREQYLTKVERKWKVGDAKGVIHTSPSQRPGFISPKPSRMVRMGTGFVMVENLFRGPPPE